MLGGEFGSSIFRGFVRSEHSFNKTIVPTALLSSSRPPYVDRRTRPPPPCHSPTHLCPFLCAHWTSGVSSAPCASPWSVMATTISNQSLRYNNRSVPAPRQALIKCAARPAPLFIWKIRKVKTPAAAVLWYSDKETSYQHAVDTAHCSPRVPQPVAHTINTRSRDFTSLIGYI